MISGLWKWSRTWNSEKRDGPLRLLQLMIIPFKPEDTLVWVRGAGSWQVDRLLFGDGVGWTWTMLMLSEDSFRILVSASEEISKSELRFLISEKSRFFEVVTYAEQLHGKLTVKEASLVYSAGVTLCETNRSKYRIESLGGYTCDTPAADWT